ncbi:MAG TPA: DUF434 domain-containing protein [Tepidisphaeraceae bacterium]|nr:DUF434 domain-containing protein [Tepidisphaeraceae bacterium]
MFDASQHAALRAATADLSWLLSRGYAQPSGVKVVGDRHRLNERQRMAVTRAACSDDSLRKRSGSRVEAASLADQAIHIDGYNVLTTIEAALAGGIILHCRDDSFRDIASIHGTYRKVEETLPAIQLVGETLEARKVSKAVWLLDSPVSNSGRLAAILREIASQHRWNWDVEVVINPDAALSQSAEIIATADSVILDRCGRWFNLARTIVERAVPNAETVRMS